MKTRGFTLLEVLVSMTIVGMLCMLLANIAGGTQKVVGETTRRLDADGQAQLVFGRMGADIAGMPRRADIPVSISLNSGTAAFTFFSEVPSVSGSRGLSVVSYCMKNDSSSGAPVKGNKTSLLRASKGLEWTDTGFMGTAANGTPVSMSDTAVSQLTDADYDVLASGVIRMNIGCQLKDGSIPGTLAAADVSRIAAIVVTLVALDESTVKVLTPEQITAIADTFGEAQSGKLAAGDWEATARNPDNFPGIPRHAAAALRVYQHFFPIHSF